MTEDCGKQTEFEDYIEHKGAQYYYDMAQEHLKERKKLYAENQRLKEVIKGLGGKRFLTDKHALEAINRLKGTAE